MPSQIIGGFPTGVCWMTSYMRNLWIRYGDLLFLDCKKKDMNRLYWPYIGPTIVNNENKIGVVVESLCIEESDDTYSFVLASLQDMEPRRKLSSIKQHVYLQTQGTSSVVDTQINASEQREDSALDVEHVLESQESKPEALTDADDMNRNNDVVKMKGREPNVELYSYSDIIKEAKNLASTIQRDNAKVSAVVEFLRTLTTVAREDKANSAHNFLKLCEASLHARDNNESASNNNAVPMNAKSITLTGNIRSKRLKPATEVIRERTSRKKIKNHAPCNDGHDQLSSF